MPYAKIDVSFMRDHFAAVPEKDRAAAIALYMQLVVMSAEMLLDGLLPRGVLEAGGAQVGISRGRYARREIASAATSLREIGLLEDAAAGGSQLTLWHEHHSSRNEVESARTRAAERKRKSRGQLTIDVIPNKSQRDDRDASQRDNGVTRARVARRRSDTDTEDLTKAVDLTEPAPSDDEPDIGFSNGTALDRKLEDITPTFGAID